LDRDGQRIYRDIARYVVPERERQVAVAASLTKATKAELPVLDLCCGEGLFTAAITQAIQNVPLLAYDRSGSMRAVAFPTPFATRREFFSLLAQA
jgi:tRNA (cmo5U34)-methyltransferase